MLHDVYGLPRGSTNLETISTVNGVEFEWALGAALAFSDPAKCAAETSHALRSRLTSHS